MNENTIAEKNTFVQPRNTELRNSPTLKRLRNIFLTKPNTFSAALKGNVLYSERGQIVSVLLYQRKNWHGHPGACSALRRGSHLVRLQVEKHIHNTCLPSTASCSYYYGLRSISNNSCDIADQLVFIWKSYPLRLRDKFVRGANSFNKSYS